MADVNRGNRPLSPHLQVYRLPLPAILSIVHRMTGVGLTAGAVFLVWWLLAAATGEEHFAFVDGLMTSWLGHLVWLGLTWALSYHSLNGLRHLWWDMGYGFDLDQVTRTGMAVLFGSVVLTLFIWIVA